MANPLAYALSTLLLVLSLAGCTTAEEGDGSGTGSASAYVKDAPSDEFREVHVVFTKVEVHRSGDDGNGTSANATGTVANTTVTGDASSNATNGTGPSSGWITLFEDAAGVDVDLLNTTGAKAAFLGERDLAAGHYQQVRVHVREAYGIREDGSRENITVSSGVLRSVRSFQVEADRETRITVDIDLEKSLKQQGNGQWRMTPVVGKTTAEVVDDEESGSDTAQPGDVETVPEAG